MQGQEGAAGAAGAAGAEGNQQPPLVQFGGGNQMKFPQPTNFSGDRSKTSGFLTQCGAYFLFHPHLFDTGQKKTVYMLMLCDKNASSWRDTELRKAMGMAGEIGTHEQFLERFNTQWGEVNSVASAMIRIKQLKYSQKYGMDRTISRFDELLPYAGIDNNETMKMHFFAHIFPEDIRKWLYLQNPTSYSNARACMTNYGLAHDMLRVDQGKRPQYGTTGSSQTKDPNAMDVDAMDFEEDTNIRFTKLSPDQIENYKREGRCFNCSTKGHMSRQCPNKKNKGKRPQGNGNWRKKSGTPSRNIRTAEADEEQTEEDKEEGSSGGNDLANIRALLANLDENERNEIFGKDFQ